MANLSAATDERLAAYPRLTEAELELSEGRFDAASALVIQHLRENRNEPRGLALLGTIAMKQGALIQAERFLRQAMGLGLRSLDVQRTFAMVLNQQERLGEALQAFELLEPHVRDPQFRGLKGLILDKLGRNDEAIGHYEQLLAEDPDNTQFQIGYGHALRAAGRTADAISAYRRAVGVDAERGEAWWGLAAIKSKVLTDQDIGVMQQALESATDISNIIPLHFALGRALHDRERYEEAFEHYAEGNRLHASTINYRSEELTKEVDTFSRVFREEHFRKPPAFALEGADADFPDQHAPGGLDPARADARLPSRHRRRRGAALCPGAAALGDGIVHQPRLLDGRRGRPRTHRRGQAGDGPRLSGAGAAPSAHRMRPISSTRCR